MRLLVVGGAGYLGSVVTAYLLEGGHDVTVCDNLSAGNAWAVAGRFVPADLTDRPALDRVVADGFDAVLHLAGARPAWAGDPLGFLRANLTGTFNLLESMRAHGIRRLVHSSSAAVYGAASLGPVDESVPVQPSTPQGVWKLAVEMAVGLEAASRSLGAVSLRHFGVVGAHGALGEWHHPETHLVPLALQVAARVRPVVRILGTDYDTPDGSPVRDYVHVADVASAYVLALDATAVPGHRVYNLGTGVGRSVREVIDCARAVTGHRIPTVGAQRRPGDAAALVANPEQARAELGWTAARPMGEAIADAWDWMQHRLWASASTTRAPIRI